ncbi:MAG: glycosyl hydrolase [Alphaproteobacteria bacterium]|nr:glycosyl hydrolase [Alphaproteobacteria bacterium]
MARTLLLGTRKALLTLTRGPRGWSLAEEAHRGIPVSYATRDARTGVTWAALDHGHWGQKLHRQAPGGDWQETPAPAYPEDALSGDAPATLRYIWVIQPTPSGRIYLGTVPGGLFASDDGGESFQLVRGLWDHPSRPKWFGGGMDQPGIHSVVVDPRDAQRLWVGVSCGGVFESADGGETWAIRNKGVAAPFLPDPEPEVGQDPHLLVCAPSNPEVLWQQNHHGVYRSDDGGQGWAEISDKDAGVFFGFPIAVHAARADTAWVVPAIGDGKRMAIGGAVKVCRTEDGGRSWTSLTRGLPQAGAYDLVYRHALDLDGETLAFGSTTGNLWISEDGGEGWSLVSGTLPPIYSVRFAE